MNIEYPTSNKSERGVEIPNLRGMLKDGSSKFVIGHLVFDIQNCSNGKKNLEWISNILYRSSGLLTPFPPLFKTWVYIIVVARFLCPICKSGMLLRIEKVPAVTAQPIPRMNSPDYV